VERAFAMPRLSDALAPESVRRQLNDLYRAGDANVLALAEAAEIARRLSAWLTANMKEDAPDLKVFFHLMSLFYRDESGAEDVPEELSSDTEPDVPQAPQKAMTSSLSPEKARDTALQSIRNVREWFEQYEPSSPVSVLLRQAELMIGKKFYEVVQAIPSDLLERWSNDSPS
jgi:type VI secretion system protein ImpA